MEFRNVEIPFAYMTKRSDADGNDACDGAVVFLRCEHTSHQWSLLDSVEWKMSRVNMVDGSSVPELKEDRIAPNRKQKEGRSP